MTENITSEGTPFIDAAIDRLATELPSTITVQRSNRVLPMSNPAQGEPRRVDNMIDIQTQNGGVITLIVEAKQSVTPRAASSLFSGQIENLASMTGFRFLVVAPWLSQDARRLLTQRGINYIDLTGNVLIKLDQPPIYIRTDGATHNPEPAQPGKARLRGPKAGRLVRFLADIRPPYGIRELAAASDLALSYVSRLIETLDREALITRVDRGPIESVDVRRLLSRYAQSYDVFKSGDAQTFIAKRSTNDALNRLRSVETRTAITGSFAAVRLSPIAAPTLLAVYCDDVRDVAQSLELLPADQGANVALLRPFDSVVWDRTSVDDGIEYVAPTQAALDCLTGNGRMPAEGQALIEWLVENESIWRIPSLKELPSE
jgi:hypothetical protein